jgi:Domain of unknown function (DUF4383)
MENGAKYIRYYTLLVGIAFTIAGVGGFIPIITQPIPADAPPLMVQANYSLLLGLFPINVLHNLFHLAIGVGGLLTFRNTAYARRFLQVFGTALIILTIMGLIPQLNTTFGLVPVFGHDIWLHGLEGVIALYLVFAIKPDPTAPIAEVNV